MAEAKLVNLCQMSPGQSGRVVAVKGGHGLVARLDALGIRAGKRIAKVSSMLMRGPVTVQSGATRIAIGFGMASKIIIELDEALG